MGRRHTQDAGPCRLSAQTSERKKDMSQTKNGSIEKHTWAVLGAGEPFWAQGATKVKYLAAPGAPLVAA